MRPIAGMLIAISLLPCALQGQQPSTALQGNFHVTISEQEKQHILDGRCDVIRSTASMPASLKDNFVRVTAEQKFELANPGENFQETDVMITPHLPSRRLVLAGFCRDRWFVHYEIGGFSHSYAVLVFRVDPNGAFQFAWGGAGSHAAKSIEELRLSIASGKFSDAAGYYW
jgi:hypothetical protein